MVRAIKTRNIIVTYILESKNFLKILVRAISNKMKAHMRRKNEQYEKFSEIVDWEVANLIGDEDKLDLFYGNFKVKHYAPKFNDYVKKQLFSLIFNYQLLKYLSARIDFLMKPNHDDVISFFGNKIEIDSKNDLEESEMSSSDSIELK